MKILKILIAISITLVMSITVFAYSAGTYIVQMQGVNFRSGPGLGYSPVGLVYTGDVLNVTEVNGEWGKAVFNGVTGWVRLSGGFVSYAGASSNNAPPSQPLPGSFSNQVDKYRYTTDEDIVITWSTSSNATSYGITVKNGRNETVFERDGLTGNSVNIGRPGAGSYRFNMLGRNSAGQSPLTELVYFEIVDAPKVCTHPKKYDKEIRTTIVNINNADKHSVQKTYATVCPDEGDLELATSLKETFEPHTFANNKCTACGYVSADASAVADCKHPKAYEKEVKTTYTNTNNSNVHDVVKSFARICPDEQDAEISVRTDVSTEAHLIENGKCSRCGYVVVATTQVGYVSTSNGVVLRVRKEASLSAPITGTLPMNTQVTILGEKNNNFYPVTANGLTGWCSADYISLGKPSVATTPDTSLDGKFQQLQQTYPQGSIWTGTYKGLAWQCHGFALTILDSIYGQNANGWNMTRNVNNIQVGNLARYRAGSNYDHSIVITKINGNTLHYVDCNGNGDNRVNWTKTITKSELQAKINQFTLEHGAPGFIRQR